MNKLLRHNLTRHLFHFGYVVSLSIASALVSADSLVAAAAGEEVAASAISYGIKLPKPAPNRGSSEGAGPFKTLVISNVMLIDGRGAPPRGPVNILVKGNRIASISAARPISSDADIAHHIDGSGMYVLPGLIDSHVHIGNPGQGLAGPITPPEYIFKLWLAHGITTVRDVGSIMGLDWTMQHKLRSQRNEITAPRIEAYAMFPGNTVTTKKAAEAWVKAVRKKGADGVKLRGATKAAQKAVYQTTKQYGMGTANHHDQTSVYQTNAADSAAQGLDSLEHWYGLPEALFTGQRLQHYPADYNYSDEQWRFAEAGNLWLQAAPPGSEKWQQVMDQLIDRNLTMVPTFTIYEANRDVARARDAIWHKDYTLPALQKFFMPNPKLHGSYHFDWTTSNEVAWRNNFRRWMQFINEYKNKGGRVAAGSDAGFIFKLYGFAYIRELELLQEAGFHPLEVIQSATLNGAELLGLDEQIGSIIPGKKADLVLVTGNPVANLKRLYGTGHMKLDRSTNTLEQVGGVSYTIKDGIVFDAKALLADVKAMVTKAKASTKTANKK